MNKLKKLIAVGAIVSVFVGLLVIALPTSATTIADGDLVKTADSSAVYYIQGANKRVFPHYNVYLSWGYPADFSTVKTVSSSELAAYADANAMPFRDGSLFRGTTSSLGGKDASAVFYVENAKLRPVLSEQVYQGLFNDPNWSKVTWVPDDLLTKFNYDMGSNLTSSATHPDGVVFKYSGSTQKYVIENGKKRAISDAAFAANRYRESDVLTLDSSETYADGSAITGVESGLLTPGWSGITPTTTALTASLYNTPAAATLPGDATNVPLLRFKLTAGSSAATVDGLTFKRTDLGATTDWDTLYVYEGNDCLTPTGRTLSSDDHTVEFTALGLSIAANTSKTIELRGDISTTATDNNRSAFQLTAVDTSATVTGLPVVGNVMVIGSVDVTTAALTAGTTPVNPSVGAQNAEIAAFKIQANGDNDITFNQAVFTFTGTMSRSDITNINLYLLGETTSLASVSSISSNDTFTLTLNSPYVITKGQTKNFVLKADLAGEVGRTLKIYIEETYHLAVSDNQYGYGANVTNSFDTGDAATLTLQGGEITMTDNGPVADEIGQNKQDVVLTKIAVTSDRNVEVRKLYVTLASDVAGGANPTDGIGDLRIKDGDTGQTLMTPTSAVGTTIAGDYLMTGTFNLTANVTRNLVITVDVGVDSTDALSNKYVSADLKIVDRSDDSVATGAALEEAQIRDVATGDWILTADIIPVSISGENMTVQASALTMSEASTPVSGLTVVKGAKKVDGIGLVFTAGDASAVNIRQFSARIYVNTASTFLKANEDTSPNGEVSTAYLYDGDTLLSSKTVSATSVSGHDYGAVTFDGLNVNVAAGATKKLTIKYDVGDSLAATRYVAVGVLASTITAYDSEGDTVTVTSSDVNYYTDDTSVPDNYTILSTSGSLTMAQDSSTPDSAIVLAGTNGVVVSKVKFTATNEDWTIDKLRVKLNTSANEGSISQVTIAYGNTTKSSALSSGYANFTGLNWTIAKDTNQVLTISADLATIDSNIATTGREIKLGVDWNSDFQAVGSSQTTKTTIGSADVFGNAMYLRKSKPTVAAATADTSLVSKSDAIVHSFTVTADSSGPITVKKFKWDVNVGDINGGGELKVDTWKIYKSGSTTALSGLWSNGTTTSTTGVTPQLTNGSGYILVELDDEVEIAAGESKTFTLKARVQGVETNDTLGISLDANGDTSNLTGGLINSDLEGVKLYDGTTQSSVEFLWSDEARGVYHTDSMQSTYLDWSNGYLLNTFPITNTLVQG